MSTPTSPPTATSCPHCGGPLGAVTSATCPHCGRLLQTVKAASPRPARRLEPSPPPPAAIPLAVHTPPAVAGATVSGEKVSSGDSWPEIADAHFVPPEFTPSTTEAGLLVPEVGVRNDADDGLSLSPEEKARLRLKMRIAIAVFSAVALLITFVVLLALSP